MRLVIALACAALFGAIPVTAGVPPLASTAVASPVATQPLASGEVLLEVNAIGTFTTRADSAVLTVGVNADAATQAEARGMVEGLIRRASEVARANGVAASDIRARPITVNTVNSEALRAIQAASELRATSGQLPGALGATEASLSNAGASIEIRVRNVDRVEALVGALRGLDGIAIGGTAYALEDVDAARREARVRALAKARADAAAYAAALGMRIARIVRVTERVGMEVMSLALSDTTLMRRMMTSGNDGSPDVDTSIVIGVDFALIPQ